MPTEYPQRRHTPTPVLMVTVIKVLLVRLVYCTILHYIKTKCSTVFSVLGKGHNPQFASNILTIILGCDPSIVLFVNLLFITKQLEIRTWKLFMKEQLIDTDVKFAISLPTVELLWPNTNQLINKQYAILTLITFAFGGINSQSVFKMSAKIPPGRADLGRKSSGPGRFPKNQFDVKRPPNQLKTP